MSPRRPLHARRQPTSLDVAKAAGVSQATVSHIFNNTVGRPINPKTRERVLEAARTLGYRPNPSARALSKGYSNEIINIIPEEVEPSLAVLTIAAVQERTIQLGYTPSTCLQMGRSPEEWETVLANIFARRPVGIVSGRSLMTRSICELAMQMGVRACALVDLQPADFAPTVVFSLDRVGYMAGAHFLERGHRKVAYICPRTATPQELVGLERSLDGLRSALQPTGGTLLELAMNPTLEDARAAVNRLLSSEDHPTAIYGYRDDYCFWVLKALSECQVRVPQEIALVGTGNSPFCALSHPALTSISTDFGAMGSRAVDVVDSLIHGRQPPSDWLVAPPPQLIVRESS